MSKGLAGKKVVIGGSRKIEEISTLIEKQGGIPLSRPLQGTVFLAEKSAETALEKLVDKGTDWLIFTTGIGLRTLVDLSDKLGLKGLFLQQIQQAQVASRGYKSANVLKELGVKPVVVDEDGTTEGLIRQLENIEFKGKRVTVQLHGEEAPRLMDFLAERGAIVETILPYQHVAPDSKLVAILCEEILNHQIDAVCFTTRLQVHSFFSFAKKSGCLEKVLQSFEKKVLAVAVGKVTAEALREEGIDRYIVPGNERMGAMVVELSTYYKNRRK